MSKTMPIAQAPVQIYVRSSKGRMLIVPHKPVDPPPSKKTQKAPPNVLHRE